MFLAFDVSAVMSVCFLVFLEGMLSLDNAVVLALQVKHLPHDQQKKALTIGIWSAFVLRCLALSCISVLIKFVWLKIIAAGYLIWLGVSYFIKPEQEAKEAKVSPRSFWMTIAVVEMLDFVFSIDSIFAAVGVSDNFATIFIGGVIGIIMMRFAATVFIKLVEKFPKLETAAYVLVMGVGVKLGIQSLLH